jgi:hypothetical protein
MIATEADATLAMLAVAAGRMDEAQFARCLEDHTERLPRKPRRPKQ